MILRLVFAFRVLSYGMLFFFFGCKEQFVENMSRELLAQHRTVGDNAIGRVDERYAVDSATGLIPSALSCCRNSSRVLYGIMRL